MISELFTFFLRDLSLISEIILVSNKDSRDIVISMLFDLVHPVVNSFVGLFVCCVIHDNNSMRSLVVRRSDGLESLLTSSVPDLQLDRLAVHFKSSNFLR